jgi:hypothetical protein
MTKNEAAIIGAYTGILIGSFSDLHEYIEKIMKRPVFTHEIPFIADEIKNKASDDFIQLSRSISD